MPHAVLLWMLAAPAGNERMVFLMGEIQKGARAFLKQEYTWIAGFVVVMALLIAVFVGNALATPWFLDVYNLADATYNFSEKAIIALPMALAFGVASGAGPAAGLRLPGIRLPRPVQHEGDIGHLGPGRPRRSRRPWPRRAPARPPSPRRSRAGRRCRGWRASARSPVVQRAGGRPAAP